MRSAETPMTVVPEPVDEGACQLVSEFFSVYGNPTRISIFCALHSGVSLQNASQHLRIMRDKGAVTAVREGQRVYYAISDPRFIQGVRLIYEALTDQLRRRAGQGNDYLFSNYAAMASASHENGDAMPKD